MSDKTKKNTKILTLVKWVGGPDDGKFTVGINIEHIKSFNYDNFMDEEVDPLKIYVVEWRDTKKEPLGGWTCYHAQVLAVSSSTIVLNKRLEMIGGLKSIVNTESFDGNDTDISVDIIDPGQQSQAEGTRIDAVGKINSGDDNVTGSDNKAGYRNHPCKKQKLNAAKNKNSTSDMGHTKNGIASGSAEVLSAKSNRIKNACTGSQKTTDLIEDSVTTIPEYVTKEAFTQAMREVMDCFRNSNDEIKKLIGHKKSAQNCPSTDSTFKKSSEEDEMKEIGMEGSKIMIRKDMWLTIKQKKSFQVMGCALVFELFPKEVLLRSNYKGGAAKNKNGTDSPRYAALDKNIMDAIRYTVRKHWPNYKESLLGAAINTALSKLRKNNTVEPVVLENDGNPRQEDSHDEE